MYSASIGVEVPLDELGVSLSYWTTSGQTDCY